MTEHDLQAMCVEWFDLSQPQWRGRLFAIPNGGKRNIITARKLKAEGVRSGVPDLFLPVAAGPYHGLFIEMKKPKTARSPAGRVTKEQREWHDFLRGCCYCCKVVDDFDEFRDVVSMYLLLR